MKVTVFTEVKDLATIRESWNELVNKSTQNVVNLTYEWTISWWSAFSNSDRLHIVAAYDDDGTLNAIAPMRIAQCSQYGIHYRKLSFLVDGHSPLGDFIVRSNKLAEGSRALLDYLMTFRDWDCVELQKLDVQAQTFSVLQEALDRRGIKYGRRNSLESPFILIKSDWQTFFREKSSKFRKVLRNKLNRASKDGDINYEKVPIFEGTEKALEEMFSVSGKSWKHSVHNDLKSNAAVQTFYKKLCEAFGPLGMINLWFVRKKGTPIAFEFHLSHNNVIYPLRADYDESYHEVSPGTLLEYHILKALFDEGSAKEYNTCGDTYEYLLRWSTQTRKHATIDIFGAGLRPSLLHFLKYSLRIKLKMAGKKIAKEIKWST